MSLMHHDKRVGVGYLIGIIPDRMHEWFISQLIRDPIHPSLFYLFAAYPSSLSLCLAQILLHLFARLPADVHLLSKGDSGVVVRDLTRGGRVARRQRNAVVDVEDSTSATRRPDDRGRRNLVLLGVHLAVGPKPAAVDRGSGRGLIGASQLVQGYGWKSSL